MIFQAILVMTMLLLLATEVNSAATCPNTCGNLTIPFPFGTSSACNLDDSFLVRCNHTFNPPKPFLISDHGYIELLDISLDGIIRVSSFVASDCYGKSAAPNGSSISKLVPSKFTISSTRNKFTAIGCDTYALVEVSGRDWKQMRAGCVSWCDSIDSVVNGTCSGIGCCQTSIPKGTKDFSVDIKSFRNHTSVANFNPCGYAFVVEADAFEFSSLDLKDLRKRKTVPVVLDWSVGYVTCQEALKDLSSYACRANHSECTDSSNGVGYRCSCLKGFEGNPYVADGCQDVDECSSLKPCDGICTNLEGSYLCSCPKGFKGDGKKHGNGCHSERIINGSTMFYIISGFMIPAVGSSWIFWRRKQKKVAKLRQNLVERNGRLILETMLARSPQRKLEVFTAEDLKKATDNYDENRVLARHLFHGITYYGILSAAGGNRKVTIEQCDAVDESNVKVFVSNVVNRSRIRHRNVVRLIGLCLETQVPLLVYEFINDRTLQDCIHDNDVARSLSWDIRLRIAAQTAGALFYLHNGTEPTIIHGNLNSDSILLEHDCTVKVHYPELVCEPTAGVLFFLETGCYVDPEYFTFHRLTEKSDVYSFGVMLAELLTGEKPFICKRPGGEQNLAQYFVSSSGGDNLLRILDRRMDTEGKIDQITRVAELAQRCLSDSSIDRPTMNEVLVTLENARSKNSSSTIISPNSSQGTTTQRVPRRKKIKDFIFSFLNIEHFLACVSSIRETPPGNYTAS